MLYILIAILMFGLLIALHELGHFLAAKACGVLVNEFSIGMGPRILHRQGKETDYSLRALPIGGFCAMEGEEEGVSANERAFPNRPWWQRLIILLAGVAMNFLTGFLIILCLFSGVKYVYEPEVTGFVEGTIAQEQGMEEGDRIVAVNGHRVYLVEDISLYLQRGGGLSADIQVLRNGKKVTLKDFQLSLMSGEGEAARYGLGIKTAPKEASVGLLLKTAWYQAIDYVRMVWMGLGDILTGAVGLRDVSGVVGIVGMVGEVGEQGAQAAQEAGGSAILGALVSILSFTSFISINLAVMNLLPIPGLDGGQIFMMAVNGVVCKLRGRPIDPKYQGWVTAAGFVCLFLLMAAVTVSDVLKLMGR